MKRAPTVTSPTDAALERAAGIAREFIAGLPDRPVAADGSVDELRRRFGGPLPDAGTDAVEVVEALGGERRGRPDRERRTAVLRVRDRRRRAGGGGRRLADQRVGPERGAVRDRAGRGRRRGGRGRLARGAVRAAARASASGSRPARRWRRSPGSPPRATRCWRGRAGTWSARACSVRRRSRSSSSDESHVTIFAALQMLGMGRERVIRVATDDQGRMRADALREALAAIDRPALVCAQAGNVNTGGFDPLPRDRRGGPRQRRLAPRRRRVRAVGGGRPGAAAPRRGRRGRRLLDDRRPQVAQRAVRLGALVRRRPGAHHAAMTLGAAYYVETTGGRARRLQLGARVVAPCPRVHGLGGAALARPVGARRDDRRAAPTTRGGSRRGSTARPGPRSSTTSCSTRCSSGSRTRPARSRPATPGRTP